jgi:uncharacterized membrane protein YdjX (TVP38/TMEM64 family)
LVEKEKYLLLAAVTITILNFIVPYTVLKNSGAFAFWIFLTLLTLGIGYIFTSSWVKPQQGGKLK